MSAPRGAIVRVALGPLVGEKRFLAPGARLTLGRAERADFPVPHDRALSAVHAELAWLDGELTVRDRNSRAGTLLGGERILPDTPVAVPDGAWLAAGETSFLVRYEALDAGPARLPAAHESRVLAALSAHVGSLYAVLDGAQSDAVHEALATHRDTARSLYDGPKGEALAQVAPYLVRFEPGSRLLARVVRQGHGLAWGIFLRSRRPLVEVRRRLRRLLVVQEDTTSQRMYFRFYDPRVLREISPLWTPRQEDELFGDELEELFAEGEDGGLLGLGRGRTRRVLVPPATHPREEIHAHP